MKYNIYAGLSGDFGGASYRGTLEVDDIRDAEDYAYELAVETYESYAGMHGLADYDSLKEDYPIEEDESEEDYENRIFMLYTEEMETWLDYCAILEEDDKEIPEDEKIEL